jgi:hypothetical protein
MQPLSFSKRQLAAIAWMLDEEEKHAVLSDKKKRMWVHKCSRSRNQKDLTEEIAMEGFLHIQNLGNI